MTIKQWRYSDDGDDETAAEYLLNTIIGKVLLVLTWSGVRMSREWECHVPSVCCCMVYTPCLRKKHPLILLAISWGIVVWF